MRTIRIIAAPVLAVGLIAAAGCGGSTTTATPAPAPASGASAGTTVGSGAPKSASTSVYFGWLLGSENIVAVALDVAAPDADGKRAVKAYVCDGLGPPAGMAVWFGGFVDAGSTAPTTLASASEKEKLTINVLSDQSVLGSFTDAAGDIGQVVAYPAINGAGIYEVSLDENLTYKGTSTDGNTLAAQADKAGMTTGRITTASGQQLPFTVHSLALATPDQLAARGLPTEYTKYVANNQVPGEFVAVIAPGGSHWLGRSGLVRKGLPGSEIIGLDKKEALRIDPNIPTAQLPR